VLRELHEAPLAKDFDRAVSHLVEFPNMTEEARKTATTGFLDKREISQACIDILVEKGEFGPLKEVFPDRGVDGRSDHRAMSSRTSRGRSGI
jgi:hypothetical protein